MNISLRTLRVLGFLFFFSNFLSLTRGQNCDCTEYIYLNVPSTGHIEKFAVTPSGQPNAGALTMIDDGMGNSWYNGSDLPSPHGLAADLNGFLYVGENLSGGDIRRMTCDGELLDESEWVFNSGGQLNIQSIGNIIYFNNEPGDNNKWFEGDIMAYNTCTDAVEGAVEFCEADVTYDWGFYIDPRTKRMYATHAGGNNLPKYFWTFTEADFDQDLVTCVSATTLTNYPTDINPMRGITTDTDGNVYIARSGRATENYILKYSPYPDFNYIGQSATDNNNSDGSGWAQMIGIVYSEDANLLYTSSTSSTEDCISVFDLDLNNIPGLSVPQPPANVGGKAIAILSECCPNPSTQTINQTYCEASINQQLFLNELFPCDGIVCGAEWTADAGNTGMSYDPCDQSIIITGTEACGTFTKSGSNVQCGSFNLTYNLDVLVRPEVTVTGAGTICPDNPSLTLTTNSTISGLTYQWQISNSDCNGTWSDIGGATDPAYTVSGINTDTNYRVLTTLSGVCSSGTCVDTSACITIPYSTQCAGCNCTEYLYLNDITLDETHKFRINSDGSVTEIGSPWLDNIANPHGLGVDLNGNLYIGATVGFGSADIYKVKPDGTVLDAAFYTTDKFPLQLWSDFENTLYFYRDRTPTIQAIDICNISDGDPATEPIIGTSDVGVADNERGWGFYVKDDHFYVTVRGCKSTRDPVRVGQTGDILTAAGGDVSTAFPLPEHCIDYTGDSVADNFTIKGVFEDDNGFVYAVFGTTGGYTRGGNCYIVKYDSSGNIVAQSAVDTDDTDGGWYDARGIAVSENGYIYVGSQDGLVANGITCMAILEDDGMGNLISVQNINTPPGVNAESKTIAIAKSCCPTDNAVFNYDQCYNGEEKLFLSQLMTTCGGVIGEGYWSEETSTLNLEFNDCDNSITVTGSGCGEFKLSSDGTGPYAECGAFEITLNIEIIENPNVTVTGAGTICPENPSLTLTANTTSTGLTYQWQVSSTDCNGTWSDIGGATSTAYTVSGITEDTEYRVLATLNGTCSSGSCVDTSACVTIPYSAQCSFCDCTEYLYVNEVFGGGAVHKFEIQASGQLNEVTDMGPSWYPNGGTSELPSPHGLGTDVNGFLYIGSTQYGNTGEIRKLDCDGNLFPETGADSFTIPNIGVHNMSSIDNTLYVKTFVDSPTYDDNAIYAFDLCSTNLLGQFDFGGPLTWAFYIDENEALYSSNDQNNGNIFKFTEADLNGTTITPFITNVIGYADPSLSTLTGGITTDPAGNIYQVVNAGWQRPAQILKFDPAGNFLTASLVDNDANDGGWYGAIGIAYSETCDCLYTTNANTTEDCVSVFDLDLTYIGAGVGPVGGVNPTPDSPLNMAKAVGILKECCPNPLTQTINQVYCASTSNAKIFLNEIFPCEGIICGGDWIPDPGNTGISYDPCDQSITITGTEACAIFNKVGSSAQCGSFNLTYNLDVLVNPDVSVTGAGVICPDNPSLNLSANSTTPGLSYQWQVSSTDCNGTWSDIGGATSATYAVSGITADTDYRVLATLNGTCSSGNCVDTSACVTVNYLSTCLTECGNNTPGADAPSCTGQSGCAGGLVFEDFNCNGMTDANEPGTGGVRVDIYDCNNNLAGTTTTDAEGEWQICSLTDSEQYRVEFILPAEIDCWANPTHVGSENGSDVQFITVPACANFSLSSPADYCQDNPTLITSCFTGGLQNDGLSSLVSFPYESGITNSNQDNSANDNLNSPAYTSLALDNEVGPVKGLAYDRNSQTVYAAAYMKANTGYGTATDNAAPGRIYSVDMNSGTVNTFIELPAGNDPHQYADLDTEFTAVWDDVGKLGLADIEVSEDGQTLWAVNLFDRLLYEIDVTAMTFQTHNFASPADCPLHPATPNGALNLNIRPGGLTIEKGVLYYTLTCTAEDIGTVSGTATDYLRAYVYKYENNTHTEVAAVDLDYARQENAGGRPTVEWRAWSSTETFACNNGDDLVFYPQPWAFDIEFDEEGFLILGIADRFGDQTGFKYVSANNSCFAGQFDGVSSGDVLIFARNSGSSYTPESNGTVGGRTSALGVGNVNGPDGGEFFHHEMFSPTIYQGHTETALGTVSLVKGKGEVILSAFDPGFRQAPDNVNAGGLIWLSNTNGSRTRSYELYENGGTQTFAKASGIGDVEALCDQAPLEIGNYIWCDDNNNGIQDACEPGVDGIIVQLYDNTGLLVGLTSTTNGGQYYFNESNVDLNGINPDGSATVAYTGMDYSSQYFIVFGEGQFAGGEFTVSSETYGISANHDINGNANDNIDSDVDPSNLTSGNLGSRPDGLPFIDLTTGAAGCGNHSYDLGLNCCDLPTATLNSSEGTCAGATANNDATINLSNVNNADEAGISPGASYSSAAYGTVGNINVTGGSGSFTNLMHNSTYTVRVYNGSDNCYTDYTLTTVDISCAVILYSLGNRVFLDDNNNGIQDGVESGIDGVVLQLLNADGTVYDSAPSTPGTQALTVTTGNDGYYRFDDLPTGDYIVEVVSSNFSEGSGVLENLQTSTGAAQETSPNADGDLNDNGLDILVVNSVRSGIISLGGIEPTGESEPVSYAAGSTTGTPAADTESNLTVDFGFFPIPREDYPDFEDPNNPCTDLPCHTVSNDIYLGSGVTNDNAGSGDTSASSDIDDGVNISPDFDAVPGNTIRFPVSIYNNTGNDAYLRAWIDWNADGDFEDNDELVLDNTYNNTGSFTEIISVTIPQNAGLDQTVAMRWRISTDETNSAAPCGTGSCAADGEIEDYLLRFSCPTPLCVPITTIVRD